MWTESARTNCPSRMMPTRSQVCSTSGRICDERKTVRPSALHLGDHVVELMLIQRVEAAGRLVEDQQARLVHEGLHQPDLLLVAARILAEAPAGVEFEAVDQGLQIGLVDAAAQVAEVCEDLRAGERGVEREFAGQVADEPLDLGGLRPAVQIRRWWRCRRSRRSSPISVRMVVVLPAPFGPRKPKTSPS